MRRVTKRAVKKVRRIIAREWTAAFIYASSLAGALTFGMVAAEMGSISYPNWRWLALAGSLIGLPKVFDKLKDSREPYVIRFARAYREGFLSPLSLVPSPMALMCKIGIKRRVAQNTIPQE